MTSKTTVAERAAAAIEEQGYWISPAAVSMELCDELLEQILRQEREGVARQLVNPVHGYQTTRFHDLLNLADIWQRAPVHEAILPVVQGVIGDDCLLNAYGSISIGPGETHQPIHVDDATFFGDADAQGLGNSALYNRPREQADGWRRPILVNAIVALSDFTEANGATRVVPGSQRLPYPGFDEVEAWFNKSITVVMTKGSVCFIEGQCFHGGGANVTRDERRHALAVSYCAGYLRSQENFLLSVGEQRAATFPAQLQQLIGLRLSGSTGMGLGHVFNRNPTGVMQSVVINGNYPPKPDRGT